MNDDSTPYILPKEKLYGLFMLHVQLDFTIGHFFKSTSATMIACYIGLIVFAATAFVAVFSGATNLPKWACVFNMIPIYLVLTPLRVGGTINWSAAAMFAAFLVLV